MRSPVVLVLLGLVACAKDPDVVGSPKQGVLDTCAASCWWPTGSTSIQCTAKVARVDPNYAGASNAFTVMIALPGSYLDSRRRP